MILFPKHICVFVSLYDGWIVGGAAKPGVDQNQIRDWDVVIPYRNWAKVAPLVPKEAVPNTFGGWKFKSSEGNVIDVWPDDVDTILTSHLTKYAWHPRSNTRWIRES